MDVGPNKKKGDPEEPVESGADDGTTNRKRSHSDQEDDKKEHNKAPEDHEERKAKNRLAAYNSRMRKHRQLHDLKDKETKLRADLSNINALNLELQTQMELTTRENAQLRLLLSAQQSQVLGGPFGGPFGGSFGGTFGGSFGGPELRLRLLLQQQQEEQLARGLTNLGAHSMHLTAMASSLSTTNESTASGDAGNDDNNSSESRSTQGLTSSEGS